MLDLKKEFGAKAKVTLEESYGPDSGREKHHYYVVKGRRGEISAWDDTTIEVTVMGTPTPLDPADLVPDKTHNLSLPIKLERMGWKASHHYDDSTVFLIPKEKFMEALTVIKARKRKVVTEAMRETGRRMALLRHKPMDKQGSGDLIPPKASQSTPEAK